MSPSDIDQVTDRVAKRVRFRRRALDRSQAWLASQIGVATQQVQKYEGGDNRLTAGRLYLIAQALDCSVAYFFEGVE